MGVLRHCKTSSADSVKIAPWRSRLLVPRDRGSSGEPGIANTSRPCSPAIRAVISEPERRVASITRTPRAMPEMILVAAREMTRLRHRAGFGLGDQHTTFLDGFVEPGVLFGIDHVDSAAQDGRGAGFQRARVGRGVDSARHARHHHHAAATEFRRQVARQTASGGRGVARADHRHRPSWSEDGCDRAPGSAVAHPRSGPTRADIRVRPTR